MNIIIVLSEPYPKGMACTNRVHLYAKGLVKQNNKVEILIPRSTEYIDSIVNKSNIGVFEGIPYQYCTKSQIISKYFFVRRIQNILGPLKCMLRCFVGKPDIILFTGNSFLLIVLLKISSILTNSKLVRERSEVSFPYKEKLSYWNKIYLKTIYRFFDGLIVITPKLKEFYLYEIKSIAKIIVIPILIEIPKIKTFQYSINYSIVYIGSFLERKDGIISIIKAFVLLHSKYPQIKLIMVGKATPSADLSEMKQIIQKEGLDKVVSLTGYVNDNKLKEIVKSAIVLVLAKPINRQNLYNFPTKLGDYLLSDRPTLITDIDDNYDSLIDGKHLYKSGFDIQEIAEKLSFIVDEGKKADIVGMNGRKYAIQHFNYIDNTKRLSDFFKSL